MRCILGSTPAFQEKAVCLEAGFSVRHFTNACACPVAHGSRKISPHLQLIGSCTVLNQEKPEAEPCLHDLGLASGIWKAVVSVAMPNCNTKMSDSPVDAHPDKDKHLGLLDGAPSLA